MNWLEKCVFYEIYPQSFMDLNNDGIGDLAGIIAKLDYIQELGCEGIWLNPCFLSPFNDAGYDISDYCQVAPRYGTNADLERLFLEAHQRGIHVLLDLVPGHTSIEHPWFKASCKVEKNEFSGRYIWSNDAFVDVANYPNISGSLRGMYQRDGTVAVNFFSHQPALNYGFKDPTESWQSAVDSSEALATRKALKEIMAFWLQRGCDGFRVDMAGSLVKNDPDKTETIQLWKDIRNFLDENFPEAVLISEWGEPDKALQAGFHMDFLLHFGPSHYMDLFRTAKPYFSHQGGGSAAAFIKHYRELLAKCGGKGLICIPSGNHDMIRLADTLNPKEMKLAYAFLFSMPGVPFIYYGDEIGMRQLSLPSKEGGYYRTGARTPMQWNHEKNYGFSLAEKSALYLPQDYMEGAPTVSDQKEDPDSLYHEVKKLIALRRSTTALCAFGGIEFISGEKEDDPLIYLRSFKQERILVVINPAQKEIRCKIPYTISETLYASFVGSTEYLDQALIIPPESAAFYKVL